VGGQLPQGYVAIHESAHPHSRITPKEEPPGLCLPTTSEARGLLCAPLCPAVPRSRPVLGGHARRNERGRGHIARISNPPTHCSTSDGTPRLDPGAPGQQAQRNAQRAPCAARICIAPRPRRRFFSAPFVRGFARPKPHIVPQVTQATRVLTDESVPSKASSVSIAPLPRTELKT
jgi:hypothetical protein